MPPVVPTRSEEVFILPTGEPEWRVGYPGAESFITPTFDEWSDVP
jgi:hypothetical protein